MRIIIAAAVAMWIAESAALRVVSAILPRRPEWGDLLGGGAA